MTEMLGTCPSQLDVEMFPQLCQTNSFRDLYCSDYVFLVVFISADFDNLEMLMDNFVHSDQQSSDKNDHLQLHVLEKLFTMHIINTC